MVCQVQLAVRLAVWSALAGGGFGGAAIASAQERDVQPLVVTAGGTAPDTENAPASVTVNNREDLERKNVFDKDFNDYRSCPLRSKPDTTAFSNVYNNIHESHRLYISMATDF